MKKLVIVEVDNGWLVRIVCSGESALREPYEHGRLVFTKPDEFVGFIDEFFKIPEKVKEAES